ncbi:MAG: aminomethyltransferase family protein [Pseudomonadales bacterium]|nr:aminomethyltransferase family protein [Pseudomonadales bacterium]
MLKESPFFEFLNRRKNPSFSQFLKTTEQDEGYIDWNGSVLPHNYGDTEFEYRSVRGSCACFDVSPMRKIRVQGKDAGSFLDYLLTRPVSQIASMRGVYVIFCNEDGTLKDDAILYKFNDEDYLILPSDIDHSPYFYEIAGQRNLDQVSFSECTASLAGLAIQGPQSARVTRSLGFDDVEYLEPYQFREYEFAGTRCIVARMGFTADLGYELWLPPEFSRNLASALQKTRKSLNLEVPGYGLGALEACRIEGGFVVAGWDFATELDNTPDFERNPFEVGLGWAVDLDAGEFIGKAALKALRQASTYVIRRITVDTDVPLEGHELLTEVDGVETSIGSVNCASWSFGLERMIGNASIRKAHMSATEATVVVEGEPLTVQLTKGAYVNFERRNQVPAPLD